jgi:8-oxo-dGTP pyrophosphatase MutT (NUDIX family)
MEMRDIVDGDDRVIQTTDLLSLRKGNLMHRAIAILLFNSNGGVFVHQRSKDAGIYPDYWAIFFTGGVTTGEDYYETAVRELKEETGIENVDLKFLFKTKYEGPIIRMFVKVYTLVYDGLLKLEEDEIAQGSFVSLHQLQRLIETKTFVPCQVKIFKQYMKHHATV